MINIHVVLAIVVLIGVGGAMSGHVPVWAPVLVLAIIELMRAFP